VGEGRISRHPRYRGGRLGASAKRQTVRRAWLVVALLLITSSCGEDTRSEPIDDYTPDPVPEECIVSVGLSLEDCFTRNSIHQFALAVTEDVYLFYVSLYPTTSVERPTIDEVKRGIVTPTTPQTTKCLDKNNELLVVTSKAALLYCPSDTTIYIGVDAIWESYSNPITGEFAAAFIIAHEWGHAVQHANGLLEASIQYSLENPSEAKEVQIAVESQADCMAGAWARRVADEDRLEADDFLEATASARLWGALEEAQYGDNREHGNADERSLALQLGFENGLEACMEFFVNFPLPNSCRLLDQLGGECTRLSEEA